jgi:hypothetical protein
MKKYHVLNLLFGWISFLVAAIVYLMTIEPTVSFWDCGEFITTSFKLQVGHPPGAPFFMIIGRFFYLIWRRPRKCRSNGKYYVGTGQRVYHTVPVLDHHPPGEKAGFER